MARLRKNTSTTKDTAIKLSKWSLLYFFGYHWWAAFKKFILWVLVITVAITAIGLIRSTHIFGMADNEIARAFLAPLPRILAGFAAIITVYALIRAVISTYTTKYAFTPQGVVIQSGWPTRRTTIVDYGHIQKMTIVSNPFDRLLRAAYVQLDLIGGAPGVLLEAVDAQAVKDIQEKLSIPNHALLAAVAPALESPKPPVKRAKRLAATKKATSKKKPSTKKKLVRKNIIKKSKN